MSMAGVSVSGSCMMSGKAVDSMVEIASAVQVAIPLANSDESMQTEESKKMK